MGKKQCGFCFKRCGEENKRCWVFFQTVWRWEKNGVWRGAGFIFSCGVQAPDYCICTEMASQDTFWGCEEMIFRKIRLLPFSTIDFYVFVINFYLESLYFCVFLPELNHLDVSKKSQSDFIWLTWKKKFHFQLRKKQMFERCAVPYLVSEEISKPFQNCFLSIKQL